jgi:hypothetical protein
MAAAAGEFVRVNIQFDSAADSRRFVLRIGG